MLSADEIARRFAPLNDAQAGAEPNGLALRKLARAYLELAERVARLELLELLELMRGDSMTDYGDDR